MFSSDTFNVHLNKAILSLRPGKLIFFLFSKRKGFCEKTVYIKLIVHLKATYGKKKPKKKSNFQLLTLNTQTFLTVALQLFGKLPMENLLPITYGKLPMEKEKNEKRNRIFNS